jgi:hypothetical protein
MKSFKWHFLGSKACAQMLNASLIIRKIHLFFHFCLLAVLGFELRVLCLLNRLATTWATVPESLGTCKAQVSYIELHNIYMKPRPMFPRPSSLLSNERGWMNIDLTINERQNCAVGTLCGGIGFLREGGV